MPTCQGRYAPPEAVALLLPQARTILKYALFYHGGRHLQKILNIAYNPELYRNSDTTPEHRNVTIEEAVFILQRHGYIISSPTSVG